MKRALVVLAVVLLAGVGLAQERVNLTAPIARPSIASVSIARFTIDVEAQEIRVEMKNDAGDYREIVYANAAALISTLNRADCSVTSLQRRIYTKLIADGYYSGTVAGTPQ